MLTKNTLGKKLITQYVYVSSVFFITVTSSYLHAKINTNYDIKNQDHNLLQEIKNEINVKNRCKVCIFKLDGDSQFLYVHCS